MIEAGLFKIECLTPVHIGSGEEFVRGLDFFSTEGFTEVLDPALVLKAFGAFEGFAENIMRGGARIGEFLKGRGAGVAACRLYRVPGTIEAQKLRVAIRTGDGRPIIPGSSIKGALRTLLLTAWATDGGPHSGKRPGPVIDALWKAGYGHRTSSQQLEEAVFHFSREGLRANDPRTDLLQDAGGFRRDVRARKPRGGFSGRGRNHAQYADRRGSPGARRLRPDRAAGRRFIPGRAAALSTPAPGSADAGRMVASARALSA